MHGPHRNPPLPRADVAASATLESPFHPSDDVPPSPRTPQRNAHGSMRRLPSSAAGSSSSSSVAAVPRVAETPEPMIAAHKLRTERLTPRAMWRAPAPRPVPLPSLLPALPATHTSRLSRPIGVSPQSLGVTPVSSRANPRDKNSRGAKRGSSDGYGEEYVRLVFDNDAPPETLSSAPRFATDAASPSTAVKPLAPQRLPPVRTSTTNTITDAEAAAALAELPDRNTLTVNAAPTAGKAKAHGVRQQHHPTSSLSASPPPVRPDPPPQHGDWWSTLDGTLSSHQGPPLGIHSNDGVLFSGSAPPQQQQLLSERPPTQQQQQQPQNLNDTLGRADRAAMVLSMSYPQHSDEAVRTPERISGVGGESAVDSAMDAAPHDPVAMAVAALAERLSRAAAKGSAAATHNNNTGNANAFGGSFLSDVGANGTGTHNTIQELRDTLRMTEANLTSPLQRRWLRAGSPVGLTEDAGEASLDMEGQLPFDSNRVVPSHTDQKGRPAPLTSIVKQPQSAVGAAGHGKETGRAAGLGGVGTKRTRDALARLYTTSTATTTTTSAKGVGAASAAPSLGSPSSLSFLSRPGPSFAAPAPPVSTDAASRTSPWQCAALSLDAIVRRFGDMEATHVARTRKSRHREPQADPLHKKKNGGGSGAAGGVAARGRAARGGDAAAAAAESSLSVSSLAIAALSCVSLTSTIFVRELGDGEMLRKSYMAAMNSNGVAAAHTRGACDELAQTRGLDGASPPTSPQLPHHAAKSKKAANGADAAAVAEYRREQQRLYASHLTTRSPAAVAGDVLHPHLDVDYLFSDVKPRPRKGRLRHDVAPSREEVRTWAGDETTHTSSSTSSGSTANGSHHRRGPQQHHLSAATAAPHVAEQRDALQEAMQARQALLRRHVQPSPGWGRLLHTVRQWCDRTQVMIRLENGECVEQTGVGPVPWQTRRASQQVQHGTPGVSSAQEEMQGASLFPTSASAGSGETNGHYGDGYSPYVDDPALAHDLLKQQVAQEGEDVQRKNALQQVRQRQQQWEATMHESTLVVAAKEGDLERPSSSSVGPAEHFALGSRRSTATVTSAWSRHSLRGDATILSHESANVLQARDVADESPQTEVADLSNVSSAPRTTRSSVFCSLSGGGGGGAASRKGLESGTTHARLSYINNSNTPSTNGLYATAAVRGPVSQHAALCAKLQTWGDPVEESDEDEEGERGAADFFAGAPHAVAAQRAKDTGPLVLWRSAAKRASSVSDTGLAPRLRLTSFHPQEAQPLSTPPLAGAPRASSSSSASRRGSRVTAFRLSSAEKDLLDYVLTCASSSRTSSGAADSGLMSLLRAVGRRPSSVLRGGGVVASEGASTAAAQMAQEALAAMETVLREGLGVKDSAHCYVEGSGAFDSDPPLQDGGGDNAGEKGPPSSSLAWASLLTAQLEGYNVFDFVFLHRLHALLWRYETWRASQEKAKKPTASEVGRRRPDVTILPAAPPQQQQQQPRAPASSSLEERPPLVWPITLFTAPTPDTSTMSPVPTSPPMQQQPRLGVTVDAAELFGSLAATPTLLMWLLEAHRSSPTSSWIEITGTMPAMQQLEWHTVLSRHVEDAMGGRDGGEDAAAAGATRPSLPRSSLSTAQSTLPVASTRSSTSTTTTTVNSVLGSAVIAGFAADVTAAVSCAVWRQRVVHVLLKRALSNMEATAQQLPAPSVLNVGASTPPTVSEAPPPSALVESLGSLPRIGTTPYLPDEEGRLNYPLDMRNGYLFSSLAREDAESRVGPQLRETRRQFAEALRAARNAAAAAASADKQVGVPPSSTTSLAVALQQRVHLHRLAQIEQRFTSLLASLWNQEDSIRTFNHHVADFNAFTRAEQQRWGPLYCSSLTVAYCVCEELAEKKMENLSPELLPFVSVVATFMGCRGGHRELRAKLPAMMLELVERAKRVQVHLDSLTWQGRRAQVLAEAVTASQLSPRRAGAVVSCLATEADVVGVPLTEVALPAVQLKTTLPLPPSEE